MYLLNLILFIYIIFFTIDFCIKKELKGNKYYEKLIKFNAYIINLFLRIYKNKKFWLIFFLILFLLIRALIIYLDNDIYSKRRYGWHIKYYYLDNENKRLPELSFITSLRISLITYISVIVELIFIGSVLYFSKIRLIRVSKLFELLFEAIEPFFNYLRKGYYGGLKYHTSIIAIFFTAFSFYVIWVILSFRINFHTIISGVIVVLSVINYLIFLYSVFLMSIFLLFSFEIIKNEKIKILMFILEQPVKLKIENYIIIKKYKFNTGLLTSSIILIISTILLNHILNDVLFQQYNFTVL